MITVNPGSINDLLALKASGAPVTMTSHPGNASVYKLTLWSCGIPEHLWDVTCCVADANNWPMFRIVDGRAELLLEEELHRRIVAQTNPSNRFVTAYQKTPSGERLGRVHVRACEACSFPEALSSTSRLLLSEAEKVKEMFEYLAETRPNTVFARFITPDGVMKRIRESGTKVSCLANSFMGLLKELEHLLFSDAPISTQGGTCYDGVIVQLSAMLVQYWQTGRVDRYDVSGPDMIGYSVRREYQEEISAMLAHLRQWDTRLIPKNIVIRMFPGTVARVSHVPGHISEHVMARKIRVLENQIGFTQKQKEILWDMARDDNRLWPTDIKPQKDYYFSQYDLLREGGKLVVDDFWKDIPLDGMRDALVRANNLLRIK